MGGAAVILTAARRPEIEAVVSDRRRRQNRRVSMYAANWAIAPLERWTPMPEDSRASIASASSLVPDLLAPAMTLQVHGEQ